MTAFLSSLPRLGAWLSWRRLAIAAASTWAALAPPAQAQDRPTMDVLNLEAAVSTEVAPDLAVVTVSLLRDGADLAAMTQEVESALARALADARATPGVQPFSGGVHSAPRYDRSGQHVTWQMRADLILKSKDFAFLGKLVGNLTAGSNAFAITGATFEVSDELKQSEESQLIARGVAAFRTKATESIKALGYASFGYREVSIGEVTTSIVQRPVMLTSGKVEGMSSGGQPMPLEGGRATLQLNVRGSVQMRR